MLPGGAINLREELDHAMALAGCARVADATRELLG
jgi:isopentenyl diphosphate isomerase/L-lactate dehydrogenase-like FMN-dependent dehydrogenase